MTNAVQPFPRWLLLDPAPASLAALGVALVLLSSACGGGSPGPIAELPPPSGPACTDPGAATGSRIINIESSGVPRDFRLFVPETIDPTSPVPLVLNFHGLGSNAIEQEAYGQMVQKANAEGFITAAGNGIGNSWNAGQVCCAPANRDDVDDVQFVRDMVARIATEYCIDASRIFATGMSNGGFLSNRLACEASDLIAAIGPVASTLGFVGCAPARPVPIMMFNGTEDPLVAYAGAENGFARWRDINGCTEQTEQTFANGDSVCVGYVGCADGAETILCTVEGGGHTWPGSLPLPQFGHTTTDMHATDAMWEFFTRHPLP